MDKERKSNYEKARENFLKNTDRPISHELIKEINRSLIIGSLEGYRNFPGVPPVRKENKKVYYGASDIECEKEMDFLLEAFLESELSIDSIIEFHWKFVKIHPFSDGNGRTARLLMVLQLLKIGYSDEKCKKLEKYLEDFKKDYYDALDDGKKMYRRKNNVSEKFKNYMLDAIHKGPRL